MNLFCLFKNEQWLQENGLASFSEVELTIGAWGVELTIRPGSVTLPLPDRKAHRLIQQLQACGVLPLSGSIEVHGREADRTVLFKHDDGAQSVLRPLEGQVWAEGICFPDILLLGKKVGVDNTNRSVVFPVVIYDRQRLPTTRKEGPIPIAVDGLAELLFPNLPLEERGFVKPDTRNVVPRVIVVKGAVGTGKTTLATQMMIGMAEAGFVCDYWCSNDKPEAIKNTATSFGFCSPDQYDGYRENGTISVLDIGNKYLQYLNLARNTTNPISGVVARLGIDRTVSRLSTTDVLFLDSLNPSEIVSQVDRRSLWEIFNGYRRLSLLSFFLLEDYGKDGKENVRQLLSDCEFLADVVLELAEEPREGYHAKSIKVKKKHYGEQVYGTHFYKICPVNSSLPDMSLPADSKAESGGIIVLPSIHRYLSRARVEEHNPFLVNTGITHLDAILSGGSRQTRVISRGCIESNSCIVISGQRGAHKLPLGLNLLMGGMWKIAAKREKCPIEADRDVLLILLDEEADIHIALSATARHTHLFTDAATEAETLDNGRWIQWKKRDHLDHNRKQECAWSHLFTEHGNVGKKVHFNRWCASIDGQGGQTCRKLVVAGFRPGCITPEEFIYIIDSLLKPRTQAEMAFSRALFVSTAHLQNRFPLLGQSKLLIPALVDLFKSRNVVSIFIDVLGAGADERLSYGLAALADYIIRVDAFSHGESYHAHLPKKLDPSTASRYKRILKTNNDRYIWSRMHVENVRGKEYSRACHAVTVRPSRKGNDLYVVNAREEHVVPLIFG